MPVSEAWRSEEEKGPFGMMNHASYQYSGHCILHEGEEGKVQTM